MPYFFNVNTFIILCCILQSQTDNFATMFYKSQKCYILNDIHIGYILNDIHIGYILNDIHIGYILNDIHIQM